MKKTHRGYTIDVIVTKNGKQSYTAKVWIGPTLKIPRTLCDVGKLENLMGRDEAKQAGYLWGEERINAYIENRHLAL
jgi:hypothetical protein